METYKVNVAKAWGLMGTESGGPRTMNFDIPLPIHLNLLIPGKVIILLYLKQSKTFQKHFQSFIDNHS